MGQLGTTTSGRVAVVATIVVGSILTDVRLPAPVDAERVAADVIGALNRGENVTLDFQGIEGLTTAFATVLFRTLFASFTPEVIRARVHFRLQSQLQREVMQRSVQAAREPSE